MQIQHKIKCYVFIIALSFLCVSKVYASLEITEIMYAPESGADYEWVEVYNNDSEPVDLKYYVFFRGDKFSALNLKKGNTLILKANEYAIIAKSMTDYSWLDFSGSIFSASTLSLPDNSEIYDTNIKILNPLTQDVDSLKYDTSKGGSKKSGTSLSKIDGEWTASTPTPGSANEKAEVVTEDTNTDTDTTNENDSDNTTTTTKSSSSSSPKEKIIVYPIETKIISQKTVVAGLAFLINSETFGTKKEKKILGRFVWNFGDGNMKEEAVSNPFEYIYEYPGDYILTLSYFDTHFSVVPEAIGRMIIKVVPSQMTISSVGDYVDPFIELENKSPYEINLSKWQILSSNHSFIFPEGMIVLPNKKLKLSPKVTGFTFNDLQYLTLKNPSSEIVSLYPQTKPFIKNTYTTNSYKKAPANLDDVNSNTNTDTSNIINLNDLEASAVKSSMNLNINYYLVALFFVIGAGIASVFLLKKKDNINHDGVEGPITANDIKIIE